MTLGLALLLIVLLGIGWALYSDSREKHDAYQKADGAASPASRAVTAAGRELFRDSRQLLAEPHRSLPVRSDHCDPEVGRESGFYRYPWIQPLDPWPRAGRPLIVDPSTGQTFGDWLQSKWPENRSEVERRSNVINLDAYRRFRGGAA